MTSPKSSFSSALSDREFHNTYLAQTEEAAWMHPSGESHICRRPSRLRTLSYVLGASVLLINLFLIVRHSRTRPIQPITQLAYPIRVANSTLEVRDSGVTWYLTNTTQFGAIYAVSRKDSPRRLGLERAATLTGLDIKIPAQPEWQESDIKSVKAIEGSTLGRGSALAWLGHLNALKRFLNSSHDTALIIEDDVDFDTHIRTEQIPSTAFAIRELLNSQNQSQHYYGDPALWDILWLGHCGDFFDVGQALNVAPVKIYTDETLPPFEDLHPWTRQFLLGLGVTSGQKRLVHRAVNPLCTFAYAVTRKAAERLVHEFAAREPSRPKEKPCSAFDVRMLEACRDGGFNCITVTPELFHHTPAPSEIAAITAGLYDEDVDEDNGIESTPNIRCSARSELWWHDRRRPYNSPRLRSRTETMSMLAQQPGKCYLDTL